MPPDDLAAALKLEAQLFGEDRLIFLFHRKRYLLVSPTLRGLDLSPEGVPRLESAWKLP